MKNIRDNRENYYYWLFFITTLLPIAGFSMVYFLIDVPFFAFTTFGAFLFLLGLGILSYKLRQFTAFYRFSLSVIFVLFFLQTLKTGGMFSPAIPHFIITILITFFYKSKYDRKIAVAIAFLSLIGILALTSMGKSVDLVPEAYKMVHGFICNIFVFSYLLLFVYLFRESNKRKNRMLRNSLSNLEKTTMAMMEIEKLESQSMLSSGLIYELNNPLNYISGLIEPIKTNLNDIKPNITATKKKEVEPIFEEIENFLDLIRSGSKKASKVIQQLIDIVPHSGQQESKAFDLNETLQRTGQIIRESNPFIEFKFDLGEDLMIEGNQVEINQVFINIIENSIEALKFTANPEIQIYGYNVNGEAVVEITDNGSGIPDFKHETLFAPHSTSMSTGKGAGLGLYIAKEITKQYDGRIEVYSKMGEGTTFMIFFPTVSKLILQV